MVSKLWGTKLQLSAFSKSQVRSSNIDWVSFQTALANRPTKTENTKESLNGLKLKCGTRPILMKI